MYLPETNILVTRFLAEEGVSELTDYMPIDNDGEEPNEIVRKVAVIRGDVRFQMCCMPRFSYARCGHQLELSELCATFRPFSSDCPPMSLHSTVRLGRRDNDVTADFRLKAGETATFLFGSVRADGTQPELDLLDQRFRNTVQFWKAWISKSRYKGRWREMVHRSALMLKLLISRKHGSLIAAPTFSLPETIGGVRNWDYRFTWLRDASFTLYALIRLGFVDETEAFIVWLKDRLRDDAQRGPLQVMYGVDGRQELEEISLDQFCGYENSRPVRIGNAAYKQLHLDIYGEMMDSVYLANKYGKPISHAAWQGVHRLLEWLRTNWRRPDEGIWEVRGEPREFLHSRVMCWVAFDRALRLAQKRSLSGPLDVWQATRDEIRNDVFTNFWSDELKAFEEQLIEDTLVRRYQVERTQVDGLPGSEGTFTPCSFWYVECLARAGELEKAQLLFEKLLGYANHLGLYSEELGADGRHLGNFPQAFTHLALISAASYLDRALSGPSDATWR